MAKSKKRPVKQVQESVVKKPNKFELLYNRKKFNVLGKKIKGDLRSRVQSRSEATDKRKATLLVEHKQRQRANAFLDKRFGENDSSLTADDRAIARFQKQRLKEHAGSRFNLEDPGDDEQLTHLGADLGSNLDEGGGFSDGDEGSDLDHDATGQLHFGGGFTRKEPAGEDENFERPKTKKEVMEEIIAKSKKARAEKTKQREEDLDAVEKLDEDLAELVKDESFQQLIRPKGVKPKASEDADPQDAAFDIARRELVFEAKAKVGERTKTGEEIEQAEVVRLQALERQRRALMSGDDLGDEAGLADEGLPAGGYARKRAKRRRLEQDAAEEGSEDGASGDASGSNLDMDNSEDSANEDSEEGSRPLRKRKLSLDERRQERAAGSHPLQQRFKQLSSALLKKHTGEGSGDDEEGKDGVSESGETGEEEQGDAQEVEKTDTAEDSHVEEGKSEDSNTEAEPAEQEYPNEEQIAKLSGLNALQDAGLAGRAPRCQDSVEELPFVIPAPKAYDDFRELVAGRAPADLVNAIRRIRITNRAALAAEGKQGLQLFYGMLIQHFANLAGKAPPPMALLDALTVQILELTPEVPLYAATVALARVKRMQEDLAKALQEPEGRRAWPSQRQMLLLKLWGTVFQASDRRHPVITPAALVIGACLCLSPVSSWEDVLAGLFLSALGLQISGSADRLMPEPLLFALDFLRIFTTQPETSSRLPGRWALQLAPSSSAMKAASVIPLTFGSDSRQDFSIADLAASCVSASLDLIARASEIYRGTASFPELFAPALTLLQELEVISDQFPLVITKHLKELGESIRAETQQACASRKPLQKQKIVKEIKQFNPRFEEDFAQEKDYDVDRERAEARKLKRMVTKERRGAMRELRKDAAFMGAQTSREKEDRKASTRNKLRANSAWLQKLEQDFKSGGQGGMWRKKRK